MLAHCLSYTVKTSAKTHRTSLFFVNLLLFSTFFSEDEFNLQKVGYLTQLEFCVFVIFFPKG